MRVIKNTPDLRQSAFGVVRVQGPETPRVVKVPRKSRVAAPEFSALPLILRRTVFVVSPLKLSLIVYNPVCSALDPAVKQVLVESVVMFKFDPVMGDVVLGLAIS